MSEEKKSWDSIPSLDGLQVDWDFQPGNPHGRRSARRLTDREVSRAFGLPYIPIKIATARTISRGILQDISENGLAVRMQDTLQPDEPVKLGFFWESRKSSARGRCATCARIPLAIAPVASSCSIWMQKPGAVSNGCTRPSP